MLAALFWVSRWADRLHAPRLPARPAGAARPAPPPDAGARHLGGAAPRLADRRRLRRGGGDRGQGRQRAGARLPARAAGADRRLRRFRRRDGRARPRGRRRPGPRAAPRRQDRRPERRRRARLGRDPRLLRRQQRLGARTPCATWSSPSPTRRRLRLRPGPLPRPRRRATSRAPTGATRWRCGRWSPRSPASPPATARSTPCAASAYLPLAPSGSHDLSFPFQLAKQGLALALRPLGACRGEDGADHGGRVRPQTADDGRALGHRRRRADDLARAATPPLYAFELALAPAAALPDAVPAPARLRRQPRRCSARAGSTSPHTASSWPRSPRRSSAVGSALPRFASPATTC